MLTLLLFTFLVPEPQAQIMLARASVAECGWYNGTCHAAVMHTMQNRARRRGQTLAAVVSGYCAAWDPRTHTKRSKWVTRLRKDLQEPPNWPQHLRWERYTKQWRRVYNRAGGFLRGAVRNPCQGRPYHTGRNSGADLARAQRAHWRMLRCGNTGKQRFWR